MTLGMLLTYAVKYKKTSLLISFFSLFVFFIFPPNVPNASSFNPIREVKKNIPSENKGRVWYANKWRVSRIAKNVWEVKVSDAIWHVSKAGNLCAENGKLVSLCSENGTAKRYSGIPFCKPLSICKAARAHFTPNRLLAELKRIDFSKLTYTKARKNGLTYTVVKEIPESIRICLSKKMSEYERKNQKATYKETCRLIAKRYRIPEKAVKAIYFEGATKGWQ